MSAQTLAGLAAPYLSRHACPHALHLAFGSWRVDVRVSDERLLAWLRSYYRDFLAHVGPDEGPAPCVVTAIEADSPDFGLAFAEKAPDPGKSRVKEEWADLPGGRVVRKRLTGMAFLFGPGLNLAIGPCLDNPNQVVNFVNNRFIGHMLGQGCLLGHAAGVALPGAGGAGGSGLALAGFSGMGKSTLALHMMNLGLDFVSNDRVMVCREGGAPVMHGVAKMPRVNPGTVLGNPSLSGLIPEGERAAFRLLPPDELWNLEHKHDAFIDDCFGPGRFRLEAPLKGLAVLNWRRGGQGLAVREVDIASRADLLPAFMKSAGLFAGGGPGGDAPEPTARDYVEALQGCAVLEVTGGADFLAAARELAGWLGGCP